MNNEFDCKNFEEIYAEVEKMKLEIKNQEERIHRLTSKLNSERKNGMYLNEKINLLKNEIDERNEIISTLLEERENLLKERKRLLEENAKITILSFNNEKLTASINFLKGTVEEKSKTISTLMDDNESLIRRNNFITEQLWCIDNKTEDFEKKINSLELKNKTLGKVIGDALEKINDIRNELLAYKINFHFDAVETEDLQGDCK